MKSRVGTFTRTPMRLRGRIVRVAFAALVAASVVSVGSVSRPTPAVAQVAPGPPFEEVGQVPLYDGQTPPGEHRQDGWLVINPTTRRGYQFFRTTSLSTTISSFDLDDYSLKRSVTVDNLVIGGLCQAPTPPPCASTGSVNQPGDIAHAVDEQAGKVYFGAIQATRVSGFNTRTMAIAEIDEAKFEAGSDDWIRYIGIPPTQIGELTGRDLVGFDLVRNGPVPKLLLLFSNPYSATGRQMHEHWLAQWDAATGFGEWTYLLQACARGVIVNTSNWQNELPIVRGENHILVPCQASQGVAQAVRIPIDGSGKPDPDVTKAEGFPLPRSYINAFGDPVSERLLFQTEFAGSSWWVFDGKAGAWVGSVGMSLWAGFPSGGGFDPGTGRLYGLVPDHYEGAAIQTPVQGTFGYTDTRLTPVPQLTNVMREMAYPGQMRILIDPPVPGVRERRLFVRRGNHTTTQSPTYPSIENDTPRPVENFIRVIVDRVPVPEQPDFGDVDKLTVDRDEEDGVTESSYTGVARGFGSRVLLVGGVTGATARELEDELFSKGNPIIGMPPTVEACFRNDREIVFGTTEARVSDLTTSAKSIALEADESTKADLAEPGTRCPAPGTQVLPDLPRDENPSTDDYPAVSEPENTQQFLAKLLDQRAGQPWDANADGEDDFTNSCSGDEQPEATHVKRNHSEYDADASCGHSSGTARANAAAAVRPEPALPFRIADSDVKTSVERSPTGGIVSTVTSTVRGLEIVGVGSIGLIQARAVSKAQGRPGTATTEFTRTFCGVSFPTYQQSGCGDPAPAIRALNTVLGRNGEARLREPDALLREGSPGGYQAGIKRDERQAFTDRMVTRDDSTAIPGLEIIFYKNDNSFRGAGRQVFQFAGVEATSAYGIKCLLGTNAAGTDCALPQGAGPANLTLSLTDENDDALEGGVFKVHKDVDGDGQLGVDDPVITNGTCATEEDGTGSCHWTDLPSGDYVIEQSASPAGYTQADDLAINLIGGLQHDVHFFNVRAIGGILLGLVEDTEGRPLEGGAFELYQDDGDGTRGGSDRLYAACVTDAAGLCEFELPAGSAAAAAVDDPALPCMQSTDGEGADEDVLDAIVAELGEVVTDEAAASELCVAEIPLGKYIVHQSAAPTDYEAVSDFPFGLTLPRELALVVAVNGLTAIEGAPATPGDPGDPGEEARSIPAETIVVDEGSAAPDTVVSTKPISSKGGGGLPGLLRRIAAAPASAVRFLFSNPRELGLMVTVWTAIWLPCYLAERRRILRSLRDRSTLTSGVSAA